ncbi:MAG: hypothetical protein ABI209_07405 [Edaphobacter sp.]
MQNLNRRELRAALSAFAAMSTVMAEAQAEWSSLHPTSCVA